MKKTKTNLKMASILLILHGIIEIFGFFTLFAPAQYASKVFLNFGGMDPELLTGNLGMVVLFGPLWGVSRIIAALGINRKQKWAVVFGCILSTVTLITSISIIPSGIMDTLFSVPILIFLLRAWFGTATIEE